ncbi:hypothetical protein GE061_007435 [Apolygus lucorum]|uniref:C2CD3 N-terminal C2 domain-containing protein n=1 Tax=Apolygus lucorum TaxID=248454 RepID=A0A6A4IX88_APOLU|nr:hypothetical protein GE061_007435 [Apolygus lucorum]
MSPILIPPGVCGRIRGSISISVDEVFWSGPPQGDVYVKFSWWGSDEVYEFSPKDSTRFKNNEKTQKQPSEKANSFTFPVGTSIRLLENYFNKWKSMGFNVYRTKDKRYLGCAQVENLECILADSRFSSYFPILDKKGVKLGDLRVAFSLHMKKKKYKLKSDFPIVRNVEVENLWGAGDSDLLADLVSRGQELRKDMVKSVLSSCETKDVDEVVEETLPPARLSEEDRNRKAKLVDFLMGKELTEPEKEVAMNTLRCTSPSDSILEVAASIADNLRENSAQAYEETSQKKFCSVGEKEVPSVEDKRLSDGRSNRNCAKSNNFGKETHHQIAALDDCRLGNVSRQSFGGSQKLPVISFRITFGVMTLTALGLKKVSTSPTIKPLSNRIRAAKSPGIVFSLETVMPYSAKSKPASLKPVTLSSKAFGGNDVVFNDSIMQKFRPCKDSVWLKVSEQVSGLPIKVYWRCLNQRLPSLLGQCLLPEELDSEDFESSFHLTVQTAYKQAAAMLACKIELGTSKVFGNELLGDGKRKKTRLESMLPQLSEVPPSRASVVSEKTLSQENSKESFSFPPPPIPPPSSRCRTASSATSTNIREPSEPDQHLMNAISNLNEKLTKKSVQVRVEDADENAKDKDSEKSKPTSARLEESQRQGCSETAGPREDEEGVGVCQNKSPRRGCCCCCRGCPGDCKRRRSTRKKHLRDRRPPSSYRSAGKHDEHSSTAVSNSEGGMSPGDQEILDQVNAYLRGSRFHSPPTKLTKKHRNTGQASRLKETSGHPKRLDALFNDDQTPREFKSQTQAEATYQYKGRKEFDLRSPEELPSVHRFNVNVYSSDAQIFYREGELELYMAYRFPQTDPVSGKLFCPAEVSSIELSGDAAPVTHYLPLRTSLSEALLTYPKQNVTFHIWARAYMYEKRDFLIGQAKLPLEKLVEWEAAHIYSQKRRTDPLLPPDKHFINLRIHPSKTELPQHLEPGRIAQLGLEIDYEKFRDVGDESFDRWPLNLAPSTDSPPVRPSYNAARDRNLGAAYSNVRSELDNDSVKWRNSSFHRQDFHPSPPPGDWGVRVVNNFSDQADSRLPASSKFESGRKARLGLGKELPTNYRSTLNRSSDLRDDDELMLILDGRSDLIAGKSDRKTNAYGALPPERHLPEADHLNGTWGDANLQYHSTSRIEPANASTFVPDPDCLHRLQSPRVDRDFPAGVQTADISTPNNSDCQISPFEASVTVHPPPIPKPAANTRLRVEDQSSPLPALARAIDPNYCVNKGPSPIQNLDSSFDLGSESKATQTTVNGQVGVDLFPVRIEVEAAINLLPSLQNGVHSQPSSRVEFDAWSKGTEIIVQSSVVHGEANPKYNSAWNVDLPAHLLYKGESEFELRVVNVDDGTISTAFIDLTTLSAGLPSIDGWYFLSSHGHKSAGQVKVSITPMESIRKYRDEWIEEFRKRRHESRRCIDDRISCESAQRLMLNDSSSTKFKEKMKELEQLTERMKEKLLNVERWDDSPCSLMREVNDFAQQLVKENHKSKDNRAKTTLRASTPSQGLPEIDMRTVQEFCPVDSDGDQDFHPKTFSVTAENTPPAFRDYVPASRIRQPFSKTLSGSREKFEDSDDSAGILGGKLSLEKCHKELEQLPKDSLDAASIAIEQMIADLRNQKIDDSKS